MSADPTAPVEAGARAAVEQAGEEWDDLPASDRYAASEIVAPIVAAAITAHDAQPGRDAIGSLVDAARTIAARDRTIAGLRAELATVKRNQAATNGN